MEYAIKGSHKFLCLSDDGTTFTSIVTKKAYKSPSLTDIIQLYDILLDNPYLYYSDTDWSIIEWEKALDDYVRYEQQKNIGKKQKQQQKPTSRHPKPETKQKRPSFSKSTRKLVYDRSNHKCAICGKELQIEYCNDDDYATVDHIIPLNKGGQK